MLQKIKKEIIENNKNCKYLLKATIEHVDEKTNEVLRTGEMIIGRSLSAKAAEKYANHVKKYRASIQTRYENGNPISEDRKVKRNPFVSYQPSSNKVVKEVIKSIDIIKQL